MQTCLPELILVGFEGPIVFSFGDRTVQLFVIVDVPYMVLNMRQRMNESTTFRLEKCSLQDSSIGKSSLSKGMMLL